MNFIYFKTILSITLSLVLFLCFINMLISENEIKPGYQQKGSDIISKTVEETIKQLKNNSTSQ